MQKKKPIQQVEQVEDQIKVKIKKHKCPKKYKQISSRYRGKTKGKKWGNWKKYISSSKQHKQKSKIQKTKRTQSFMMVPNTDKEQDPLPCFLKISPVTKDQMLITPKTPRQLNQKIKQVSKQFLDNLREQLRKDLKNKKSSTSFHKRRNTAFQTPRSFFQKSKQHSKGFRNKSKKSVKSVKSSRRRYLSISGSLALIMKKQKSELSTPRKLSKDQKFTSKRILKNLHKQFTFMKAQPEVERWNRKQGSFREKRKKLKRKLTSKERKLSKSRLLTKSTKQKYKEVHSHDKFEENFDGRKLAITMAQNVENPNSQIKSNLSKFFCSVRKKIAKKKSNRKNNIQEEVKVQEIKQDKKVSKLEQNMDKKTVDSMWNQIINKQINDKKKRNDKNDISILQSADIIKNNLKDLKQKLDQKRNSKTVSVKEIQNLN